MPISSIFEIGKRSLLAYQAAIQTTSQNVSNANNEDYNRRRAQIRQSLIGYASLGLGTEESIRLRQRYVEHQLWQANHRWGEYSHANTLLMQVESIFAERTESGINNLLNEFWSAWNNLANDPESETNRNFLRDKTVLLTDGFQRVHRDLKTMQEDMRPEISAKLDEINEFTQKLADLNRRLRQDQNNPDLLDERDRLIKELSQKLDISIKEKENGMVNIYSDGFLLVYEDEYNPLKMELVNENDQEVARVYVGEKELTPHGGELKAMLDVHNQYIPDYLAKLDNLAVNIAQRINEIHESGVNIDGVGQIPFFDENVSGAADFKMSDAVYQNPSLIATRLATEGEGSNTIAAHITDVQYERFIDGHSINEYYNTLMREVGNKIQETGFMADSQELVIQQIKNQEEAVTGVSLDEEMAKMVQYQQAYQAAAKIVNTVTAMVDTVLQLQ